MGNVKYIISLLAAGLFSALTAAASDSSGISTLSATSEQQIQTGYPMALYKLDAPKTGNSGKWKATRIVSRVVGTFKKIGRATAEEVRSDVIIRYGKESSRAWTSIACSQPNLTLTGDCSVHDANFGVGF